MGSIVHGALEAFGTALQDAGNPPPGSDAFVQARRAFALRDVVRGLRRQALDHETENPRVNASALAASVSVDGCITAFKRLVTQAFVNVEAPATEELPASGRDWTDSPTINSPIEGSKASDDSLEPFDALSPGQESPSRRKWLSSQAVPTPAILPEVELEIDDPPIRGTIDLVLTAPEGDTIVEFKTGEPHEEHQDQTAIYSMLWWITTGRSIRRRLIVYAEYGDVILSGLAAGDLLAQADRMRERITEVKATLIGDLPPARPAAEMCPFCPVRQLCGEYWQSPETITSRWTAVSLSMLPTPDTASPWRDLEIDLTDAETSPEGFVAPIFADTDGAASEGRWRLVCTVPARFHPGSLGRVRRVRLLGVGLRRDGEVLRVAWSSRAEAFWS